MDVEDRAKFNEGGAVKKSSLREKEDIQFVEDKQNEIDADGAVRYSIEDSLLDLDLNKPEKSSTLFEQLSSFSGSIASSIVETLGYAPSNLKEIADKLENNSVVQESQDEYKKVIVSNVLSKQPVVKKPVSNLSESFYKQQQKWESDHGDTPIRTHDKQEQNKPVAERSLDVGFGHKIKKAELASGTIYGIPFKDLKTGTYIPLTSSQKRTIQKLDIEANVQLARNKSWDATLKSKGMSYESLPEPYKLVLEDIAYNVGGNKAAVWSGIFDSMKANDTVKIVGHLRRKDGGQNTAGMDNRAAKAAYAAGLIKSLQEAKDAGLVKANTNEIPA